MAIDTLKLEMLKLVMMHDTTLSPIDKHIVSNSLPEGITLRNFITDRLIKPIN